MKATASALLKGRKLKVLLLKSGRTPGCLPTLPVLIKFSALASQPEQNRKKKRDTNSKERSFLIWR